MEAGRRARLLAGGLIGGALVVAERRRRRPLVPLGLRAFEDAPCFRADHAGAPASPAPPSGVDGDGRDGRGASAG